MKIKLKLDVPRYGERPEDNPRDAFWERFNRDSGRGFEPRLFEAQLHREFAQRLEGLLNSDLEARLVRSSAIRAVFLSRRPPIRVHLLNITYGSIELWLNIFGITNDAVREQVFTALLAFGPMAFNQTLQTDVPLSAQVEMLRGETPSKSNGVLWALMNGSLLIPIGLSLYVLYVAFNALEAEKNELKKERSELFNALAKQNADLSSAIVTQSGNLAASAKAMQDLQSSLVQEQAKRLVNPTALPSPSPNSTK